MKYADQFLDEVRTVLKDRGTAYDLPQNTMESVAARWSLTLGITITAEQATLCMIDLKLARLSRFPQHEDSARDVVGYAAILNEIVKEP